MIKIKLVKVKQKDNVQIEIHVSAENKTTLIADVINEFDEVTLMESIAVKLSNDSIDNNSIIIDILKSNKEYFKDSDYCRNDKFYYENPILNSPYGDYLYNYDVRIVAFINGIEYDVDFSDLGIKHIEDTLLGGNMLNEKIKELYEEINKKYLTNN